MVFENFLTGGCDTLKYALHNAAHTTALPDKNYFIIDNLISSFSFLRCGWTIINLFSLPAPQDLENGHENVPTTVSSEIKSAC